MENKKKKTVDLSRGGVISTIIGIVEAVLFLTAGVLAIAYSGNGDFQRTLIIIVGAFLIFSGLVKCLINFLPIMSIDPLERAKARFSLVAVGSFELAFGVSLIVLAADQIAAFDSIIMFIANFIGIFLIVGGTTLIIFAIAFLIRKLYRVYLPIVQILVGLVAIALGIVVLVYMNDASNFMQVILILIGLILCLVGLGMMIGTISAAVAKRKAKKEEEAAEETVDVEASVPATTEEEPKEEPIDVEAKEADPKLDGPKAIEEKKED